MLFLTLSKINTILTPNRICPIPAMPEIDESNTLLILGFSTCVSPLTRNVAAVIFSPI